MPMIIFIRLLVTSFFLSTFFLFHLKAVEFCHPVLTTSSTHFCIPLKLSIIPTYYNIPTMKKNIPNINAINLIDLCTKYSIPYAAMNGAINGTGNCIIAVSHFSIPSQIDQSSHIHLSIGAYRHY